MVLVNASNLEQGVLPDIYYGLIGFFSSSLSPMIIIVLAIVVVLIVSLMVLYVRKLMAKVFSVYFIIGIFILLLAYPVLADQSKLFFSPFYISEINANDSTNFSVSLSSLGNFDSINSAIVNFDVWMIPSVNFSLLVNNQHCNTLSYYVSDRFFSSGKAQISFDCSNIIKDLSDYNLELSSNKDVGSISGWMDVSYNPDSKGSIQVHGTEYTFGQTAKPFLQLLNSTGENVDNAVCFIDVYTPSGSYLVERAVMTNFNHDGIYYYDINPVPSTEGVYPVIARCYYTAINTPNFASSVSLINGSLDSGDVGRTNISDGSYLLTTETSLALGNPRRYWAEFNFSSGRICNISELLLTGLDISWIGRWNSNVAYDNITISIWNYTSSSWLSLPNQVVGSGTGVKSLSNSFAFTNITKAGFVNASGTNLRLKFQDYDLADASSTGMDYDYLSVSCEQLLSSKWETIRGSSELHVSAGSNFSINASSIAQEVWNYSDRNLTYYQDIINYSRVAESVWSSNQTISSSLLSQFISSIWGYTNRTITSFGTLVTDIWSATDRNLTYYQDVNNYSQVAQYVWNYNNRNLTLYQVNNISVEDIWSYMNRTLTFYPNQTETNYSKVADFVWNYVNRNLTLFPMNNLSVEEIWSYYNRSLTEDIPLQVWSYPNRNLTTDIPFEVWNYNNRSLTYYTLNYSEMLAFFMNFSNLGDPIDIPITITTQVAYSVPTNLNVILYVPY